MQSCESLAGWTHEVCLPAQALRALLENMSATRIQALYRQRIAGRLAGAKRRMMVSKVRCTRNACAAVSWCHCDDMMGAQQRNLERRRGEGNFLRKVFRSRKRGDILIPLGVRFDKKKASFEVIRADWGQNAWRDKYLPAINMDINRTVTTRQELMDDISKDYREFKMRLRTALQIRFAMGPSLVSQYVLAVYVHGRR